MQLDVFKAPINCNNGNKLRKQSQALFHQSSSSHSQQLKATRSDILLLLFIFTTLTYRQLTRPREIFWRTDECRGDVSTTTTTSHTWFSSTSCAVATTTTTATATATATVAAAWEGARNTPVFWLMGVAQQQQHQQHQGPFLYSLKWLHRGHENTDAIPSISGCVGASSNINYFDYCVTGLKHRYLIKIELDQASWGFLEVSAY